MWEGAVGWVARGKKKAALVLYFIINLISGAAGACCAAAGACCIEIDAAVELESVDQKIHLDGLGFLQEFPVDQILKPVNIKRFIVVSRLIQSHGQSGATSTPFIEKDTDRLDLFSVKVGGDLFRSRRCHFQHVNPP